MADPPADPPASIRYLRTSKRVGFAADVVEEKTSREHENRSKRLIKDGWKYYNRICSLFRYKHKYDEVFRELQLDPVYPYLDSMVGLNDPIPGFGVGLVGDIVDEENTTHGSIKEQYNHDHKLIFQKAYVPNLSGKEEPTNIQLAEHLVRQAKQVAPKLTEISRLMAKTLRLPFIGIGPIKDAHVAVQKAKRKYQGDVSKVTDYCRVLLVVDDIPALLALLEFIRNVPQVANIVRRVKLSTLKSNRDSKIGGYRDCIINLEIDDHICEIQVHLFPMWQVCFNANNSAAGRDNTIDGYKHHRYYIEYNLKSINEPFDALDGLSHRVRGEMIVLGERNTSHIPIDQLQYYHRSEYNHYFALAGIYLKHGLDLWAELILKRLIQLCTEEEELNIQKENDKNKDHNKDSSSSKLSHRHHHETILLRKYLSQALFAQGKWEEAEEVDEKVRQAELQQKEQKNQAEESLWESILSETEAVTEVLDSFVDPNKKQRLMEQDKKRSIKASKQQWRVIRTERFPFLEDLKQKLREKEKESKTDRRDDEEEDVMENKAVGEAKEPEGVKDEKDDEEEDVMENKALGEAKEPEGVKDEKDAVEAEEAGDEGEAEQVADETESKEEAEAEVAEGVGEAEQVADETESKEEAEAEVAEGAGEVEQVADETESKEEAEAEVAEGAGGAEETRYTGETESVGDEIVTVEEVIMVEEVRMARLDSVATTKEVEAAREEEIAGDGVVITEDHTSTATTEEEVTAKEAAVVTEAITLAEASSGEVELAITREVASRDAKETKGEIKAVEVLEQEKYGLESVPAAATASTVATATTAATTLADNIPFDEDCDNSVVPEKQDISSHDAKNAKDATDDRDDTSCTNAKNTKDANDSTGDNYKDDNAGVNHYHFQIVDYDRLDDDVTDDEDESALAVTLAMAGVDDYHVYDEYKREYKQDMKKYVPSDSSDSKPKQSEQKYIQESDYYYPQTQKSGNKPENTCSKPKQSEYKYDQECDYFYRQKRKKGKKSENREEIMSWLDQELQREHNNESVNDAYNDDYSITSLATTAPWFRNFTSLGAHFHGI